MTCWHCTEQYPCSCDVTLVVVLFSQVEAISRFNSQGPEGNYQSAAVDTCVFHSNRAIVDMITTLVLVPETDVKSALIRAAHKAKRWYRLFQRGPGRLGLIEDLFR